MAILSCNCQHENQDSLFGKGKRVHNLLEVGMKKGLYRCTVCRSERGKKNTTEEVVVKKKK